MQVKARWWAWIHDIGAYERGGMWGADTENPYTLRRLRRQARKAERRRRRRQKR